MKKSGIINKQNIIRAAWILFAIISMFIWLPKIYNMFGADKESVSQYISLNDSWDITINDESYLNVSLDDFVFHGLIKGDEITMQRTLPDNWNITEGALRLIIWHTATKMYIDDEQIYEYGYDRMAQNKTVGSGLQFINFPSEYQGKTFKIHLIITEDNTFSNYDSIRIYEWNNAYKLLMTENRIPLFFGCFLTIFGVVILVITVFALAYSIKYIKIFCISLFSLFIGLWTLCYYDVILIFAIPLYTKSLLEYLMLYLGSLPLLIYLWEDVKSLNSKLFQKLYWCLFAVYVIATAFMIALHTFDIVHFAATLKYIQILIIFNLAFAILIELMNLKRGGDMSNKLFLFGVLIMSGCVAYDLIIYYNIRYMGGASSLVRGVSSIGVVIFIYFLIASFYLSMTQKLMQEKERSFLIKSAYTDELTQIHNRRYCIEYMNRIKDSNSLDYTVICFDLNNLKVVNDTLGHAQGDILIKSAAEVIAKTYESYGIVARMGGDEFIAIIDTANSEEIAKLSEQFLKNIKQKNDEIEGLNMSIAYGYASLSPNDSDIEKIYQIADDRMYEHKKKMKSA
ncbi:MAG: GGDEF domain-containing protein [Clostridiales bacterium]|nr:GGDEF domain-containing protein [Clostridiales bacterium]